MSKKYQNKTEVKAKKYLGQHFLEDETIAQKIADALTLNNYKQVLEIGPGMGVLTKYLLKKPITTYVIEIDTESVDYLKNNLKIDWLNQQNVQDAISVGVTKILLKKDFPHEKIEEIVPMIMEQTKVNYADVGFQ